jgi:hypothetical protein
MARTKQTDRNRKRRAKENDAGDSANRSEIKVKVQKEKSKRAVPMKVTSGISVASDSEDGGRKLGNAFEVELSSKVKDKLQAVVTSFGVDGAKLSDCLKRCKGFIHCCKDRSGKQCSPLEVIRETMSDDIEIREIEGKNRLFVKKAHKTLVSAAVGNQVEVEVKTETGNDKDATEVNLVVSSRDLQVLRERMPDYEIREIAGKKTLCIKEAFVQNGTIREKDGEGAAMKRARFEACSASAPFHPHAEEEALRTKRSSNLFTIDRQGQSVCSHMGADASSSHQ